MALAVASSDIQTLVPNLPFDLSSTLVGTEHSLLHVHIYLCRIEGRINLSFITSNGFVIMRIASLGRARH